MVVIVNFSNNKSTTRKHWNNLSVQRAPHLESIETPQNLKISLTHVRKKHPIPVTKLDKINLVKHSKQMTRKKSEVTGALEESP